MIYIYEANVVLKNGETKKKPEFIDVFLTKKEFKLYVKLCYEELFKELGRRFDDKKNLRDTNYDLYFFMLSDE